MMAAHRPCTDDRPRAVRAPPGGPRTSVSDGTTPDGDFIELDWLDSAVDTARTTCRPKRAAVRAVPRSRRQFRFALRTCADGRGEGARLARRGAAFSELQRTDEPAAALLPSRGFSSRSRLDLAAAARAQHNWVDRGGRVYRWEAMSCCAGCASRQEDATAIYRCRRRDLRATRCPRGWRSDIAGIRPGVHAQFSQDAQAQGDSPNWCSIRDCSTARPCWPPAPCTPSTTPSPRPSTVSAIPTTTGRAPPRALSLPQIAVADACMLNARNDPFLPGRVLPSAAEVSVGHHARSAHARWPCRLHDRAISGPYRLVVAAGAGLSEDAREAGSTSISISTHYGFHAWMRLVKQALAKWPNVPHCTGWLLLDRRGQWRMRDDADASGRICPATSSVTRRCSASSTGITPPMTDGQWFFQNGPQRVYVELGYTPWIVRLSARRMARCQAGRSRRRRVFEPAAGVAG